MPANLKVPPTCLTLIIYNEYVAQIIENPCSRYVIYKMEVFLFKCNVIKTTLFKSIVSLKSYDVIQVILFFSCSLCTFVMTVHCFCLYKSYIIKN